MTFLYTAEITQVLSSKVEIKATLAGKTRATLCCILEQITILTISNRGIVRYVLKILGVQSLSSLLSSKLPAFSDVAELIDLQ